MKAILTNGREIIDVTEVKSKEELLGLNKIAMLAAGRGFIWREIPCEVTTSVCTTAQDDRG
jgi:hypothetical protein